MALYPLPDLFALIGFYVKFYLFLILVIPTCDRISWPAFWSTFGRMIKYCLIDRFIYLFID